MAVKTQEALSLQNSQNITDNAKREITGAKVRSLFQNIIDTVFSGFATKVDKVEGKGLSSNDYSTEDKARLANTSGTNTGDQDLSNYIQKNLTYKKIFVGNSSNIAAEKFKTSACLVGTGGDYTTFELAYAAGERNIEFCSNITLGANFTPTELLIIDTKNYALSGGSYALTFNNLLRFTGNYTGNVTVTTNYTIIDKVAITGNFVANADYIAMTRSSVSGTSSLSAGSDYCVFAFNRFANAFSDNSASLTNEFAANFGAINKTSQASHFYEDVYHKKTLPSSAAMVEKSPAGLLSATKILIPEYISDTTAISRLETVGNWTGVSYTGTAITGTYQGQKHYNSTYMFFAVGDNIWIRIARA